VAKKRVRWSLVLPVGGAVMLAVAVVLGVVAPRDVAVSLVVGVFGIIGISVAVGAPLRRAGSPKGPHWRLITYGVVAMIAASLIVTLPPHSYIAGALILVLGAGLFCIGTGMLGGGWYGIVGACGGGLLGAALMMAPTPLALAHVGVTVHCRIPDSDGIDVYDFTAVCPGGHRYPFLSKYSHTFPHAAVDVLVDPNGVLEAEYVGEHDPAEDLPAAVGSILLAAGVVIAAAVNRSRRRGQVAHVVKPPITT
jgi:hypothetical protein